MQVTRKLAKRYRDVNTCACPSCLQAYANRSEVLVRLKKALKKTLEPSPRSRK